MGLKIDNVYILYGILTFLEEMQGAWNEAFFPVYWPWKVDHITPLKNMSRDIPI